MKERSSLYQSTKLLIGLIKDLLAKVPSLFFALAFIVYFIIDTFISSDKLIMLLIGIIILIISLCMYIKTNKISDTTLSFILGILTMYSIDWGKADYKLFIGLYIMYIILLFSCHSIKLGMKQENILKQAAYKIDPNIYNETYTKLKALSMTSTNYNILSIINRCEVMRYLAFRKVDVAEYKDSIRVIELIHCICQMELMKSCEIYYSMFMYCKNHHKNYDNIPKSVERMIDKVTILSISYEEFFDIFKETKYILINGKLDFDDYLISIEQVAIAGYGCKEIIDNFKKYY